MISEQQALELLEQWKRAVIAETLEERSSLINAVGKRETQEEVEERIRDDLFIESGVNVDEIMKALKEYGLKMHITEEDRERFLKEEI